MDRDSRDLLKKIVIATRESQGDQAHRIMPVIWPLLCEADKMFPVDSTKELSE